MERCVLNTLSWKGKHGFPSSRLLVLPPSVHFPYPFAKRTTRWQYPSKRNGNIIIVVVAVVSAEAAEDTRNTAGGSCRTAPMFLGENIARDESGRAGWNGDRRRGRDEEATSGVVVGRAAQACASSRLESRRIPKRSTPLRPRHGSHASVSPD